MSEYVSAWVIGDAGTYLREYVSTRKCGSTGVRVARVGARLRGCVDIP